jgi:hypothetical protein
MISPVSLQTFRTYDNALNNPYVLGYPASRRGTGTPQESGNPQRTMIHDVVSLSPAALRIMEQANRMNKTTLT